MHEEMQDVVNHEEKDSRLNDEQPIYVETALSFLYQTWWRVELNCLDCLPDNGPALLVGNTSGYLPWPALMFAYAASKYKKKTRTIYTMIDSNLAADKDLQPYMDHLHLLPWSYDNAKQLLEKGEIVMILPEDKIVHKSETTQNRTRRFDWTKFLPAVELHVPIHPLATLGIDEAHMFIDNSDFLSQFLNVKSYTFTLPFPFNLASMPVPWKMKLLPAMSYRLVQGRETIQEEAKKIALRAEGDVQAEINRLLRARSR